jgi:hypothetical protein
MTKPRKQKRQDECKVIDTIEQAVSTAITIYKAIEPILRAILTNGRKTK